MRAEDLLPHLICPACGHGPIRGEQSLSCGHCNSQYRRTPCGYDLTPSKLPASLEAKMPLWEALQSNGLLSYRLAPELNLATPEREDVAAFRAFMVLAGRVLDVGCGPLSMIPGYIDKEAPVDYVGLDPLDGEAQRSFAHVKGIAERLPFADATFDRIIFATSLDHLLDMEMSLKQAARVLKPEGRIYLWTDNLEGPQDMSSSLTRAARIVVRGAEQALAGIRRMGVRPTFRYLREAVRMRVPDGAVDYFHVMLPTVGDVVRALSAAGLRVVSRRVHERSLFLEARRD